MGVEHDDDGASDPAAAAADVGGQVLRAKGISVQVGGSTILEPTSLELRSGRLVGLIGPSGGGKTTLLRCLAGETMPVSGEVTIGGEPLARRTDAVGYVPFGDLLHERLTVREALGYAAALRALPDATAQERRDRVDEVLDELSLTDRGDAWIHSLSGGERRRAAVGLELLGHPRVLLLDEPAAGLDARLERRLMETLRELAQLDRAVVVATHATASLELCDDIAVMGRGGRLRFYGAPQAMLEQFGIAAYERVYEVLEAGGEAGDPVEEAVTSLQAPALGPALAPERVAGLATQAAVLASRYSKTFGRDRATLGILVVQAPVIGLAIGFVLPEQVFQRPVVAGYYGVMLAFMVTVASMWLGVISSCREIVKEQAIVLREAATGVRLDAFLISRCMLLFPLGALQAALMIFAVVAVQPLEIGGSAHLALLGISVLTTWAAVCTGLWLSAWARSSDQATSSVPLLMIPQMLLAGAVIPVSQMIAPVKILSLAFVSRWSLTGTGTTLDLDTRLGEEIGAVTGYDPDFFARDVGVPALALVVFILLSLSGAGVVLDRRIARSQAGLSRAG